MGNVTINFKSSIFGWVSTVVLSCAVKVFTLDGEIFGSEKVTGFFRHCLTSGDVDST